MEITKWELLVDKEIKANMCIQPFRLLNNAKLTTFQYECLGKLIQTVWLTHSILCDAK